MFANLVDMFSMGFCYRVVVVVGLFVMCVLCFCYFVVFVISWFCFSCRVVALHDSGRCLIKDVFVLFCMARVVRVLYLCVLTVFKHYGYHVGMRLFFI